MTGHKLLEGKRGIILGVANNRSIAWACAQMFAKEGAQLAFSYLGPAQEKRLKELVTEIPDAHMFPCDLSKDEEIENFVKSVREKWDGIDFIIHSAAYADKEDLKGQFVNTSRSNFAMALDVSAYSLVGMTRAFQDLFKPGGSVVAMTYYGAEKVVPRYNIMGVAKAALELSAKYLAEDLGAKGVRVNCISAGPIRTLAASAIPGFKAMLETTQKYAPLRRNVSAEEVAKAALFLVSDLSSGTTGEILHVDSGYNILGMFVGSESSESVAAQS